jgi:glycine/D-amino acid oxidase-like deaminating enzyme
VINSDPVAGRSLWCRPDAGLPATELRKDIRTDVLLVGAGITGALVAEALSAAGRGVTVIDKHASAEGSTTASTSLLLFEIDNPLILLSEKIGKENAARVWRRSFRAMQNLSEKISALKIECDYAERDALYLPGKVLGPAGLRRECEARKALGFPSRVVERDELLREFGIDRPCAILSGNAAESHPVDMALGILRHAQRNGAKIYAPAEAVSIEAGKRRAVVTTSDGHRITADFVVFCCGYQLPQFLSVKRHQIVSTWAAASKPQPQNLWPSRALIWEAADPYVYIRTTPDGRVVIGGEDERHNDNDRRAKRIAAKVERFRGKLGLLMPQIDFDAADVEFAWSGAFGASATGLPVIGNVPGLPRVCTVLGFGGNGTTYAQVASEMIANALSGKAEPDIDLFAFGEND